MSRQPLYERSELKNRNVHDTVAERDKGWGRIRSYAGSATSLTVVWDLNEDAIRDGVCIIKINGETAYVDKEQLLKFLRWV